MQWVKLTSVRANPNNPRVIRDEKFAKLKQSIIDFPEMLEKRPLVCYTEGEKYIVLGGNMRLKALSDIGAKEIPIILADEWTEEQRAEFLIKDNVGFGEWDWNTLANEWDADKLTEWGLDLPPMDAIELEAEEDNYEMPDELQTDIVLGDLFEIGEHRLLCGDSTDSDQVAKLMNGQKADMAHNDPPYGMKKEKDGVLNDNLNYDDLLDFNREWIALQFMHLKENGSWYCWGIDEPLMDIYSGILKPYIKEQKATFRNLITWNKGGFGSGGGTGVGQAIQRSFFPGDEKCLFVMLGVQGFNNNSDNYFEGFEPIRNWLIKEKEKSGLTNEQLTKLTATTHTHYWSKSQWAFPTKEHYNTIKDASNGKAFVKEYEEIKKEYEEIKKEYEEIKKEWYSTRAYFDNTHDMMTNVWEFARHRRDGTEGKHSTPKPIPLCERAIKSSCPDDGLVLDMFLGSGSTMVASHQLKRKCYGMELDPKYCQVIVDRMIKLDPTLEIKRNGQTYNRQTTDGQ
jgi:DNA modification methylase